MKFIFIMLQLTSLFANMSYSKAKFFQILSQPLPHWAEEQLEFDFSPFNSSGYSLKDIENLYWHCAGNMCHYEDSSIELLRLRTINGKVFLFRNARMDLRSRAAKFCDTFSHLNNFGKLPNVEIVICDSDSTHSKPQNDFFWSSEKAVYHGLAPLLTRDKYDDLFGYGLVLFPDYPALETSTWIWRMDMFAQRYPWYSKKNAACWRGSLTDLQLSAAILPKLSKEFCRVDLFNSPRYKLCELSLKSLSSLMLN